jgi:hypothetical protein
VKFKHDTRKTPEDICLGSKGYGMKLVDRITGRIVAREVEVADTFWSRFRGLMFRRRFPQGKAILFRFKKPGRHAVHMFFVRFPIDLLYLNRQFKIVEIREALKPWRFYRPKHLATNLVELPAGSVRKLGIKTGDQLEIRKLYNPPSLRTPAG